MVTYFDSRKQMERTRFVYIKNYDDESEYIDKSAIIIFRTLYTTLKISCVR